MSLAHEFWISPERFVYPADTQMQANLKVGQEFAGPSYTYNPRNFTRFEVISGSERAEVVGRLGDMPALSMPPLAEGLNIVVHETDDSQLSYTKWEKFTKFVDHKAFPNTLDDHVARGLSKDEKFIESYRRFAKSLIAIGHGRGEDQNVGLRTEIVVLDNPYHLDGSEIAVQVFLEGQPKANTQIELFEKAPDGSVEITLYQTGADGTAQLPVKRGYSYLVDNVSMLALDNDDASEGPVWESLWASMTFQIPETPLK